MILLLLACRQPPCTTTSGYLDLDGDGYGQEAFSGCDAPETLVELGGDCDDQDPLIYPDAEELCDGVDLNCDGQAETLSWWVDIDQDGFGAGESVYDCEQPDGHSAQSGDCDDANPSAWPGGPETWYDDIDQDCDGGDDWDQDGDGSPYPLDCDDTDPARAPTLYEVCDTLVDEDCNGLVDEDCQFFGGIASGDAYLQINGLEPSEWGEQQYTGASIVVFPDLDGDGISDFGVCSDTDYNGGFHLFGSSSLPSGVTTVKDAEGHLEHYCGGQSYQPRILRGVGTSGSDGLSFGDTIFSMDNPTGSPLTDRAYADSILTSLDFDSDGVSDLLYRLSVVSPDVYAIEGPVSDLPSDADWRSLAVSQTHLGSGDVVAYDYFGSGLDQALVLNTDEARVTELFLVQAADAADGLSRSESEYVRDISSLFSYPDTIRVFGDADGDGLQDPVVVGDNSGVGQSIVGFGSAGAYFGEPLFSVELVTGRGGGSGSRQNVALGDLNGDDVLDLVWSEAGEELVGVVYVVLGPLEGGYTALDAHGWLSEGQPYQDDCEDGEQTACVHSGAGFGASLAVLDHNADGIDDLLIGAPLYETEAPKHGPGAVFLFLGAEGSPW